MTLSINLLRAALLPPSPEAATAFHAWQSTVDLDNLPSTHYVILPLLARNLERMEIDHPWLPKLKGIYRRAWYANQLALRPLARLTASLKEAGIPCLLVGAAALGQSVYPEIALRPVDFLRLLVPQEQVVGAVERLLTVGWQLQPANHPWRQAVQSPWQSALRFSNPVGDSFALEWRALALWPSAGIDEAFFRRAVPMAVGESTVQIPEPTDHLLRVWASLEEGFLTGLVDAAHLIRAGGIDWPRFVEMAIACQLAATAAIGLGLLAQSGELGIPGEVIERLEQTPLPIFERHFLQNLSEPATRSAARRLGNEWQRFRYLAGTRHIRPTPGRFLDYLQARTGQASRRQLLAHGLSRLVGLAV